MCIPISLRKAFHDELTLLQKVRHPNVVQFLGAVTQSTPMMIVTEYLPQVSFDGTLSIRKVLMIFYSC
jgi:serine/threonine protein kinase